MRMRREQSGPHIGVPAHHPGILLRMAPVRPSFQLPPAQRPRPLAPLSARPWLTPRLWAWTPTAPDTHCFQPPSVCKVSGPRGFPGSPGATTSPSNARVQVRSLVREVRCHMYLGQTNKQKVFGPREVCVCGAHVGCCGSGHGCRGHSPSAFCL